jgi:hypothetical protein
MVLLAALVGFLVAPVPLFAGTITGDVSAVSLSVGGAE